MIKYLDLLKASYGIDYESVPLGIELTLGNQRAIVTWVAVQHMMRTHRIEIHHTEECIEAYEEYKKFKDFIEEFGGYFPRYECDCPRDRIKIKPEEKINTLKIAAGRMVEKHKEMIARGH